MQNKLHIIKKAALVLSIATLTSTTALANGGGGGNGFVNAAKQYEEKANKARANGNNEAARIYTRMAEIKRTAAAGKLKNWDEYHKLSAQLKDAMGWDKGAKKHADKKSKEKKAGFGTYKDKGNDAWDKKKTAKAPSHDKKEQLKNNGSNDAEKRAKITAKYEKQAQAHMTMADEALKDSDTQTANIHNKLAQILVNASILVGRGKQPDLTEYYSTQKELFEVKDNKGDDDVENW